MSKFGVVASISLTDEVRSPPESSASLVSAPVLSPQCSALHCPREGEHCRLTVRGQGIRIKNAIRRQGTLPMQPFYSTIQWTGCVAEHPPHVRCVAVRLLQLASAVVGLDRLATLLCTVAS